MNLLEKVSYVRSLLGDVGEDALQEGEIIANISHAQNRVINILINAEREKFVTRTPDTLVTVASQADYVLPLGVNDIFRVSVDGLEYSPLAVVHGSAPDRLTTHRPSERQRFFIESKGEAGRPLITLVPTPDANGQIIRVWYVQRPEAFHPEYGIHRGTVTTPATTTLTTTRIVASGVPFAGSATKSGVNDFWNGHEIMWLTGKNKGIRVRVLDFDATLAPNDYGVLTLRSDDALPNIPTVGDTFDLCQVSVVPPQHHELLCMWAAALSAPKAGIQAAPFMEIFNTAIASVAAKMTDNVERNLAGQSTTGGR